MSAELAATLNSDCHAAPLDRAALERALRSEGGDFFQHVSEHCPHLYAPVAYFISRAQAAQMHDVIAAVEQVVSLTSWRDAVLQHAPAMPPYAPKARGVFMGYDFHLNADGAHLIEINTNAGGAFLNALLLQSQSEAALPGEAAVADNLEQVILDMFRHEWRMAHGDTPLQTVAIVDEQPMRQYLYPEFVLAQRMLARAGITALIAAPEELEARGDGLYRAGKKIDLVYNRLTDFYLQQHVALDTCFKNGELTVITPHPLSYALHADKYNLTLLSCDESMRAMHVPDTTRAVLQAGIPQTRVVRREDHDLWWGQRKQWFFKPASGFGSRGAYRGASVTHRVFEEIMQGGYVAQRLALPGERSVCGAEGEIMALKADVRCFAYDGKVHLVAARLYQGQTTNFRTVNGGFAQVRIVG